MFCPNCGKETKKLIDNKCSQCYSNYIKEYIENKVKLNICKECKEIFLNKTKVSISDLRKYLERIINKPTVIENYEFNNDLLRINTIIEDIKITLNISYSFILCQNCRKISQKKRTVIQFRGNVEKFLNAFNDLINQRYNIVEIIERREGLDVFLDENLISLRRYLRKYRKQGVEIKINRKLIGFDRTRSKKIYRLKILLRFT